MKVSALYRWSTDSDGVTRCVVEAPTSHLMTARVTDEEGSPLVQARLWSEEQQFGGFTGPDGWATFVAPSPAPVRLDVSYRHSITEQVITPGTPIEIAVAVVPGADEGSLAQEEADRDYAENFLKREDLDATLDLPGLDPEVVALIAQARAFAGFLLEGACDHAVAPIQCDDPP